MDKIHIIEKKLYDASLKGDVQTLEVLMRDDELALARVSISSCFNQTPLHVAAMLGHFGFAKSLLHYKPDFAGRLDSQGRSPLHLASANGYVNIVSLLLQEDPSLCLVGDQDGRTPLHLAIMNGQSESISKLVEAKPEVSLYTLDRGETILHTCVMYNRLEPLIHLLESITVDGDFTNVKDESGSTILHAATALKRTQHVKYLLTRSEQGVNEVNGNGLSALDMIEQMQKDVKTIEIKELLVAAGASRAKEFGNKANQLALEIQTSQQPRSRCNRRAKLLRKVRKWSIIKKKGENKGNLLLVAATIIAAMAYQAAISPPGGVIGIDAKDSTGHAIKPGTSILAHYYPQENRLFWRFNTGTFIASLSIVFFFVSGVSVKRKFFTWLLHAAMWITIMSMTQAYLLAVSTFSPGKNEYYGTVVAILIAAVTWGGIILVSFLLIIYRSIVAALRKAESKKKISKYRGETVLAESTSSIV